MAFAPSGSTPIIFILGFRAFAQVATPAIKPPPPTGTIITSRFGASFNISMAIVP